MQQICLIVGLALTLIVVGQAQERLTPTSMDRDGNNIIFAPLRHARQFLGSLIDGHNAGQSKTNRTTGHLGRLRDQAFRVFARLYNKSYSQEELPKRMRLFFERRRAIQASIRDFTEGRLSFKMRENAYVDWDDSELKALTGVAPPKRPEEFTPEDRQALLRADRSLAGRRRQRRSLSFENKTWQSSPANHTDHDDDDDDDELDFELDERIEEDDGDIDLIVKAPERIPATKDWRASGCVATPINQHKCGACYAIATMGVLETMRCLRSQSAPTLAPQQVVDCSRAYNNFGCDGGWPTRVLKYLQDTGVAAREICYPFVRRQLTCRLRQIQSTSAACTVNASPSESRQLSYRVLNNERDILYHVAKTGPVVTVMRATDKFLYYGSGIFDDFTCTRRRDDVDHAIVIVGYGQQNGQDYWLIKNSWGESWGQAGYGLYKRGTNACSIGHWGWVITG